jgi:hypothetical protein
MEYNKDNFELVKNTILKHLTPDLLPKKWLVRNSTNPMFGHCHTASGCLYKIFGSKFIKMYRGLDDEGIYHWWVVDCDGNRIDLTEDQYYSVNRVPPYDVGEKSGMLGFEYKKRVLKLYERVMNEIN